MTLAAKTALAIETPEQEAEPALGDERQAAAVNQEVLDQARRLLDKKQSKQAYELLVTHEYDWAGNPEYDQLLGTAAVDSGHADEAVMPLERAIAHDPDNSDARLALARAYYYSGDQTLAQIELDYLGRRGLPLDADVGIYGPTVSARGDSRPRQRRFRYYVLFDGGYDSNANASTDKGTFLGLALNGRNVKKGSGYASVSNGGILSVPLSSKWDYDLKFNFVQRRNFSATFANTDRAGLANEFIWRSDYTRIKFGAGVHTAYLDSRAPYDGNHVQSGLTLDFGARWNLGDSSWQIGTDVVAAALRHTSSIRIFDIDQVLTGFNMEYVGRGPKPSFGFALIAGEAHAKQSGSPYGRDQYGAQFTSSWRTGSKGKMYSNIGVTKFNYDGLFFGTRRDDTQYSTGLSAVLNVFPSRNWSLIPHLAHIQNQSNVALFDYNRTEIGLAVRWLSD